MIARRDALETQLDEADAEVAECQAALPSLFYRAFPMLQNLDHTTDAFDGTAVQKGGMTTMLFALLGPMSLVALPLAILWHNQRTDVRALRRAKRRARDIKRQLREAKQMLAALPESVDSQE